MAIESSHLVWQRQRSSHHSGALRQYTSQDRKRVLRGPSASPVSCFLCHRGSKLHHNPVSSSTSRVSSEQPVPQPFTSALSLEFTPPRMVASQKKARKTKSQTCDSFCLCPEQPPSGYYSFLCNSLHSIIYIFTHHIIYTLTLSIDRIWHNYCWFFFLYQEMILLVSPDMDFSWSGSMRCRASHPSALLQLFPIYTRQAVLYTNASVPEFTSILPWIWFITYSTAILFISQKTVTVKMCFTNKNIIYLKYMYI